EEVAWFQVGMRREGEVRDLSEVRMGPTDRLASHRVRRDLGDFDLRVSEEEPQQFPSGVPGAADDPDFHRPAISATESTTLAATSIPVVREVARAWGFGV